MADIAIPGNPGVVSVPFHGDEILTIEVNGKPYVILKPALERLGLDYWAQVQKLKNRSWAALASRQVQVPGQAQRREMLTCDARTFAMLLATVDENRVGKDVRDRLVAYQCEVADVIEAYWDKGGAIKPRSSGPELDPDLARIYELTLGMQETRQRQRALEAEQQRMASEIQGVAQDVADLKALSPMAGNTLLTLRDTARAVTGDELGQNNFKRWLLTNGIMFKDHQGNDRLYQDWVNDGLGIERWENWTNGRGQSWVPYFTPLGVARLRQICTASEGGVLAA